VNRGYQRIGENVTKGIPDIHEAIDVSVLCPLGISDVTILFS